jgi:hypothetical protein
MNLQGIVAVSGKPGLWRALAQNKTGYILESLDAAKTKLVANLSTAKLAALNEITLFGLEDDIKLVDVFERMKSTEVPDVKADGTKLRKFFREVAPDHDEEKVYASDMKKVVGWYQLLKDLPLFSEADPGAPAAEVVKEAAVAEAVVVTPVAAEKAPVKAAAVAEAAAVTPVAAEKAPVKAAAVAEAAAVTPVAAEKAPVKAEAVAVTPVATEEASVKEDTVAGAVAVPDVTEKAPAKPKAKKAAAKKA